MALLANAQVTRRGRPSNGRTFGYPVAPGETIWGGGLVGLNSSGQMQRLQTVGTVVFVGLADRDLSNAVNAAASSILVEAMKGCFGLTVPSATAANINAPVYATADNVLTLSNTGAPLQIGTLVGIDNGQTFVAILGG